MQINAKGEKVIELQSYLTDLGYGDLLDPEKIDGKFGIHTKNSVMTYQKDFGLSVDGKVGPQTWSSLCEQISLLPTTFPRGTATTGTTDAGTDAATTGTTDAGTDAATTGTNSIVKMTEFKPDIHGFHFPNNFVNKIIDKEILGKRISYSTDGRCGGMAFASLDYYFNHMPIPSYTSQDFQSSNQVPPDGHPLADYIWKRLLESYTVSNVAKFVTWTERPDRSNLVFDGVTDLTRNEQIPKLRTNIDSGMPVPLGLVQAKSISDIGNNHQVVAYGYEFNPGSNQLSVYIYDNRYPDVESILSVSPSNAEITQTISGNVVDTWRGFFVEEYEIGSPHIMPRTSTP